MISNKRGFTLIELLVVVAMIAVLMGAISTSFSSARARARVQKATAEVKVISQAILAYENWSRGGKYELEPMEKRDADSGSLGFLLGNEAAESGGKIPAMLMAQLQNGGKLTDPWGTPYKVTIRQGTISAAQGVTLQTGYYLPNLYRAPQPVEK